MSPNFIATFSSAKVEQKSCENFVQHFCRDLWAVEVDFPVISKAKMDGDSVIYTRNQPQVFFLAEPVGYLLSHLGVPNKCQHPKDQCNLFNIKTFISAIYIAVENYSLAVLYVMPGL